MKAFYSCEVPSQLVSSAAIIQVGLFKGESLKGGATGPVSSRKGSEKRAKPKKDSRPRC